MEVLGLLIGVFFFILLEGFFAGSEIALLSADKGLLKSVSKKRNLQFVVRFLDNQEEYITLTMLGYTVSIVFAATLYTLSLMSLAKTFPQIQGFEVLLAETLVVFTIIFGEIIPKSLFQHYANKIIIPSLFVLDKLRIPVKPLLLLSKVISRAISKRFAKGTLNQIRRRDIIELLREESALQDYERLVVSNILSFKERRVGEIVKPLYEVVMISESANVGQAVEKIKESGYSRIPVYRVRVDDIVGYISAYDLIDKGHNEPIKKYVREILIFSEYTPLPEVIERFNKKKEHMGIVVDERGAIVGIITLEDIVKEIIGELHGKKSNGELIKEISKGKWIVDGKLELSEFLRLTGLRIPAGNYSTLGGYIAYLKGGVPAKGEVLKENGYVFKVVDADIRRVKKVLVEKVKE